MTPDALRQSLAGDAPPAGLTPPLAALWHGAKGDWDRAHRIVQDADGSDAAWVHAWLHRVEGDLANARYWYARAGVAESGDTTEAEWQTIAMALLGGDR